MLFHGAPAKAADVTLAWDYPDAPAPSGYRIYYGPASRDYSFGALDAPVSRYTVRRLTPGHTYYFAVTALDAAGRESSYSNEIGYKVPGEAFISPSTTTSVPPSTSTVTVIAATTTSAVSSTSTVPAFTSTTTAAASASLPPTSTTPVAPPSTTTTARPTPVATTTSLAATSTTTTGTDTDGDGLPEDTERAYGTSPLAFDTDGDGIGDGEECIWWGAAYHHDCDNDGLANLLDADSDSDGYADGFEIACGSDPCETQDTPAITQKIIAGTGPLPHDEGSLLVFDRHGPSGYRLETRLRIAWFPYNDLNGSSRVATGDIDGDLFDEIIVGLGAVADNDEIPGGRFYILDHDYSQLGWGRIQWDEYNEINGETRPACGDVDADGRDEILVGLGPHGEGKVEIFDFESGAARHKAWVQVDWEEYNRLTGETRPACGNLDLDAADEIIIGLGPVGQVSALPGGRFQILDDNYAHLAWGHAGRDEYNSTNGETWPACGDVDADARDEIIVGFGPGGNGRAEVLDYLPSESAALHREWIQAGSSRRSGRQGTRPACGNLDLDLNDEILVGLTDDDGAWVEIFDEKGGGLKKRPDTISLPRNSCSTETAAPQPAVMGRRIRGTGLLNIMEYIMQFLQNS